MARSNSGSGKEYVVGYCKPPRQSQFKKGASGNPHGRPRKADKELFEAKPNPVRDLIFEELARPISLKEGGRTVKIETGRAMIRSTFLGAVKGNTSQQKLALEYARAVEADRLKEIDERFANLRAYKQKWEPAFDQARRTGNPEPSQLPHPEHIDIDPATLNLVITGPMTKPEKKAWDVLKWQLRFTTRWLAVERAGAKLDPRSRQKRKRVHLVDEHLKFLEKRVPPGWNWLENLGWEGTFQEQMEKKLGKSPW